MIEHFCKLLSVAKRSLAAGEDDASKLKRSLALQLERKIFTETFWSKTAWTGGRKIDGPKKFVFGAHISFMTFFNDIIHGIYGSQLSENEFADFVKSRTRNSSYVRSTVRIPSARSSKKRKGATDGTSTPIPEKQPPNQTVPEGNEMSETENIEPTMQ